MQVRHQRPNAVEALEVAGACLAHGLAVPDAVREAQEFTWRALAAGFRPGMGRLIPDRFFWARRGAREENDTSTPETEA